MATAEECPRAVSENDHIQERSKEVTGEQKEAERERKIIISCHLELKIPPRVEFNALEEEEEEGIKTPTSTDHKIQRILECPPAPRKPKPKSLQVTRRRSSANSCRRQIFLNLSNEIDSLFPLAVRASFSSKIRKVRKEDVRCVEHWGGIDFWEEMWDILSMDFPTGVMMNPPTKTSSVTARGNDILKVAESFRLKTCALSRVSCFRPN
ncbi:hypothetical protein RJ641_008683 [Dillenia turbinata]|uniref:Uncharacterized protein n=1 Tax=Dillenia turbinata TaxID=194707 RepID=A0AAN8V5C1_9MAGN